MPSVRVSVGLPGALRGRISDLAGTFASVAFAVSERLFVAGTGGSGKASLAGIGSDATGGPGCMNSFPASRRRPSRKYLPSERQFFAMAENCSRCHLMTTREPTSNGRFTRTHAPECDVSSIVAGTRFCVPASSQRTSATAHITVLGSYSRTSISSVSAKGRESLTGRRGTAHSWPRAFTASDRTWDRSNELRRTDASGRWPPCRAKGNGDRSFRPRGRGLRPQGIRCALRLPWSRANR